MMSSSVTLLAYSSPKNCHVSAIVCSPWKLSLTPAIQFSADLSIRSCVVVRARILVEVLYRRP
jgi:hypothetical protein